MITADTKAKNSKPLEGKLSSDGKSTITPDITITLAVSLPEKEVRRLGRWFRQNIDPQILLDLRRDPKIIGGCQLIWQGFEGDFSLRSKFRGRGITEDRLRKTEDRIEN